MIYGSYVCTCYDYKWNLKITFPNKYNFLFTVATFTLTLELTGESTYVFLLDMCIGKHVLEQQTCNYM